MTTHDSTRRPYFKLSEVKEGQQIELDDGFTCARPGPSELILGKHGLYFLCNECEHYISGQADDGEHCVGVYVV